MNKLFHAAASSLSASTLLCGAVQADEAALFACIEKYKAIGISPDAALSDCKEKSLAPCIKGLLGKEKVEESIGKVSDGYMIDLGNDKTSWMDGHEWREKGCKPVVKGPSNTSRIGDSYNGIVKLEWFRQGICPTSELKLGAKYSLDDAKNACELKSMQEKD